MPVLAPDGGGIDPNAPNVYDSVQLVSTRRTIIPRSATTVEDVEEIAVSTTRHGVYFLRYVPYTSFTSSGWLPLVAPIGFAIDAALDLDGIDAAIFLQDVDAAGLLSNQIEFTVSVPPPSADVPGPFSTTVEIPIQKIYDGTEWYTALFDAQAMLKQQVG
jgi:hypothetical protein